MNSAPMRVETFSGDVPAERLRTFAAAGEVAWDIETSGLDPQIDRIATCQLANRSNEVLLVRIGSQTPPNLARVLGDPLVWKVFHYAVFDLSFMFRYWGVRAASIRCTKVCSRLLTPSGGTHSLQSLLASRLGVVIDKGERLSDWFARHLTESQKDYAAKDVIHLLPLFDRLKGEVDARGIGGLADACFAHLPSRAELEVGRYGDVFAY